MAVTGKGKYPNHLGILKGKGKGTSSFIKTRMCCEQSTLIKDWFFQAGGGITYFGILKRYNGSVWVKEPLKTFNGSWVSKPLKRWNGTEWVLIDTTGI